MQVFDAVVLWLNSIHKVHVRLCEGQSDNVLDLSFVLSKCQKKVRSAEKS